MANIYERYIEMMKESGFVPKKWGIRAKGSRPFFLVDDLGSPRLFETGKDASRWAESKLTSFLTTEFDVVNLANAQVYRAGADGPKEQAAAPVAHQWKAGDRARVIQGPYAGQIVKYTGCSFVAVAGDSIMSFDTDTGRSIALSCRYVEYAPEPEMTEEPDHDSDDDFPDVGGAGMVRMDDADEEADDSYTIPASNFRDILHYLVEIADANVEGQTEVVAQGVGRIEGILSGLGLLEWEDDE